MKELKPSTRVLLNRLIAFALFFIVVGLLNLISLYLDNPTFDLIIMFLNQNLLIISGFSLLFAVGDILLRVKFPFKLLYPLFSSVASIFFVKFIFNFILFINNNLTKFDLTIIEKLGTSFDSLFLTITAVVFLMVLIYGYVKVIIKLYSRSQKAETTEVVQRSSNKKIKSGNKP